MPQEIKVPSLGQSVPEATVGKWLKRVGDAVGPGCRAFRSRTCIARMGSS